MYDSGIEYIMVLNRDVKENDALERSLRFFLRASHMLSQFVGISCNLHQTRNIKLVFTSCSQDA